MGRRRPRGSAPPKPFVDALPQIDKLEVNVIETVVDAQFTPDQVIRWLLTDTIVDKLKAAFPYVRDSDRTTFWQPDVTLPVVFPAVRCGFTIKVKSPEFAMLVPTDALAVPDDSRGEQIMVTVRQVYEQHTQFEKVRRVVRWLNDNATVGAARHYCPWMTSILPADHPFQEATGQIFREPANSMVEIANDMRAASAIMASALLCGSRDNKPALGLVAVHFDGQRDSETYTSQSFGLL